MKKGLILIVLVMNLFFSCKEQVEEKHQVKKGEAYFFSRSELSTKSRDELRLIRNEIYARKGYVFKSKDLQTYFSKQSWYKPKTSNIGIELNETEKEYLNLIKQFEIKE